MEECLFPHDWLVAKLHQGHTTSSHTKITQEHWIASHCWLINFHGRMSFHVYIERSLLMTQIQIKTFYRLDVVFLWKVCPFNNKKYLYYSQCDLIIDWTILVLISKANFWGNWQSPKWQTSFCSTSHYG